MRGSFGEIVECIGNVVANLKLFPPLKSLFQKGICILVGNQAVRRQNAR